MANQARSRVTWIGGFVGWGGVIYTMTHLAALWEQESLLDEAEEIVSQLPRLIGQDEQFDVMGGTAGCLASVLALHSHRPAAPTLAAAVQCGEHLLAAAKRDGDSACWPVPKLGSLAGFAHGSGGIAAMLLRLFGRTGDVRFRDAALAGFRYERRLYSVDARNWRDLREGGHGDFPVAWCHGAAGVGLSRVTALSLLDDDEVRFELEVAVDTTAASFGNNHSLCHGDFGNLELLLQTGRDEWHARACAVAGSIVERAKRDGWRCGTPGEVESPGLMTGLAGIGFGLLRLAATTEVPSVITLDGPCGRL